MQLKEILVLHHGHLDVGYTHSQPVVWELHREYLDLALDLLEQTAGWPEPSRPKWTCEVTAPVLKWLESASEADTARFSHFVQQGRLAIGAMRYNITPLNTAAQLARQLAPVAELRRCFGARINTALQHDINGVPWPLADLLLDHGVELFVMAVNRHLGNHVPPRPGVFRWRTPSGRELRVMNGNHYSMFDQILLTWERSLDSMQRGLADYLAHLERIGYPHDFLYLTTTAAPEMWDNSPPNLPVAQLIRRWNEVAHQPRIRYVTSEDLAARIRQIPADQLPLLAGDWTDYWNFGCASTAATVARSRAAKRALDTAERLSLERLRPAGFAADPATPITHHASRLTPPPSILHPPSSILAPPTPLARVAARARDLLDLYDEHTWSYWDTANRPDPALVQDDLKASPAFEARELAGYVLTDALEACAGNPAQSESAPDSVLFVNPAPVARCEYAEVPAAWRKPGPRLRCERFAPANGGPVETVGPIELPPFGMKRVPLASLPPATEDPRVRHEDRRTPASFRAFNNVRLEIARKGDALLESPAHRLTYDPATGRILGLFDKALDWDVLPADAGYGFFDFVRERPDALADGRREAYYERDLEKEKYDLSCWKPWRAIRERATRPLGCAVTRTAGAVTLEQHFEAPGTNGLRQRLTLRADSPVITLEVELDKTACIDPEGIYFVVPLNLPSGWRCHFDTAGLPIELDAGQLPGACRNWFTAESFVAMHGPDRGVTLFCPDAPMAMAGDFHFGPPLESVPRPANPLLLAWPLNNYWNTNFPLVQPGKLQFRYGLHTHAAFDANTALAQAAAFANPIIAHPAFTPLH
jgi:hypothetical protein